MTGAIGCFALAIALVVGLITAVGTWFAATLLGWADPALRATAPTAFGVLVVLVIAFVVVGRAFARVVRPLSNIAAAADRLADGEAGVRVETPAGRGPVAGLATAFNTMADRLDRTRADRQALLADVTHELRTPLAVIAGNVEAMRDGVHPRDDAHLDAVLAETAVMARLLDDLRTLSLAEAGALPIDRQPTDVRRLVAEVTAAHQAAALETGVALRYDTDGGAGLPTFDVDPVRIREVLTILVVNALRHTPGGGTITLAARHTDGGGGVELTVADTGDGIAAADLEAIFTRFVRRSDTAGPGSGLGLTIARDLVAAHGGTITASSPGPGHGATFTVRLPIRPG